MAEPLKVGVLAFHGDVSEHVWATETAAKNLGLNIEVSLVRTKPAAEKLDALIIPGGESTTLYKLLEREHMIPTVKRIPAIFGTCAGAILLAKHLTNPATDQKTLGLMDITVIRNAYGRQDHSFEAELKATFGMVHAVFIRAPKINKATLKVHTISEYNGEIVGCEESESGNYYLALTFHPELTTTKFHEYFLSTLVGDRRVNSGQ